MAPLCCSSNCKRTQGTVDLKSRFFASLLRVTHALCLSTLLFVVNTNVPQLRPRVDCTLHRTQYTEDTVSLWISFFLAFVLKWGRWRTTGRFLYAFVRPVLSFWANLKLQTNVFSVNWQNHSKRSAGWNDTRHLMEGWGALNINNLTYHICEYQFQGIL